MTQPSTISFEPLTPRVRKITFANPPANLILPETVSRLHEVVVEMSQDPEVRVAVFTANLDGFFFNHFDLAHANEFPVLPEADSIPTWVDLVLRLSKAPFISIASIRGRTRGGGNEFALACDLRYASRELAIFGQPEVGTGILPGGGGSERLSRLAGRDRALEAILSSDDYDAELAEHYGWVTRTFADAELDGFVDGLTAPCNIRQGGAGGCRGASQQGDTPARCRSACGLRGVRQLSDLARLPGPLASIWKAGC